MLMKSRMVVKHLFFFSSVNWQSTSLRKLHSYKNTQLPVFCFLTNDKVYNNNNNYVNRVPLKNILFLNSNFKRHNHGFGSERKNKILIKKQVKRFFFFGVLNKWKINVFDKNCKLVNRIKKNIDDKIEKYFSSDGISLKDIYNLLKNERKYLFLAMTCLLISSLGQLFFPICISKIINLFGGKEDSLNYLMKEVYKTVFLIFCISTFSFFRIFFIETSIEKITKRLRSSLFEKILNQDLAFFDKQKTGELINRLSNDIEISSRILIHISFAIRNLIAAVVGGICALHISPSKLVNSFLLPVFTCLLIGTSYGKFVKKISVKKQEKLSNCIDFASERIYNISSVRLLNGEAYEKKEFTNYLNELYQIGKKYSLVKAGNHFIFFSIISLFILHLIYYGNYLVVNKYINTGDLFSLIMYSLFSGSGIQGVMQSFADIQKCLGSCSKVLHIIKLDTKECGKPWDTQSLEFLKSNDFSIRFDNVSFSYEGDKAGKTNENMEEKKVEKEKTGEETGEETIQMKSFVKHKSTQNYALKNVSFFLPHNKSVAIVGESGSGKSTILNLLTRKNTLKEGKITIGKFNINEINPAVVRSLLGVITQNPFLFNGSIKYNLLYPFKAHIEMLNEQINMLIKEREISKKELLGEAQFQKELLGEELFLKEQLREKKNSLDSITKEAIEFLQKGVEETKENAKYADGEQLQDIYKDFYIHNFLNKYENYDEINCGVNGSFLSGGEKQRVYIAQNILKDKKILILDEPTSALDKLSEEIINEALRKYMKNKSTIIFTHRLALLKFVDYIGVLKEGQIIQFDLKQNVLKNPCSILKRILRTTDY